MNAAYQAWNAAVVDRFLGRENSDRPVYLALDDDELQQLGLVADPEAHEPADSLGRAVRRELRRGDSVFIDFIVARTRWRKEGRNGPPPYVGLLALCVLAASRMARDSSAGIAANAYYPHLNELLGRPAHAGMPPGFEQLYSLWEDLDRWLEIDEAGARGRSTVQSHPHFTRIGWALSQCLLRESDRRRLTDFFRSVGLDPGTEIEAGQLWMLLRNWAHPGCGLSDRALRTVRHATPEVADQLAVIVKREFDAWDGELRDAQGRRRAEIALLLEKSAGGRRIATRLVARRPDGFPDDAFALPNGSRIELRAMDEGWYRPLELPVDRRVLGSGLTLTAGSHSLSYEPSAIVPLRASLELGAWVSVRQATAVEEHCVVSHASVVDDVRAFLRRHAQPGWRVIDAAPSLPAGWLLIEQVRITAAAPEVPHHLRRLAPRVNTATRLEGGLPIVPRQYLTRGEPDLWITVEEGQDATVEIDGTVEALPGGIAEFPLSRFSPPLSPGEHEVVAGGIRRRFTTFNGFDAVSTEGTASLGHALERGGSYRPAALNAGPIGPTPPRGTVHVSGACPRAHADDLPVPPLPPVLLPVGFDEYTLIGQLPGDLLAVLPPDRPRWLATVGLEDRWQFFDQPAPFDAQWVILSGGLGTHVRLLQEAARPPEELPREITPLVRAWAEAVAGAGLEAAPDAEELQDAWLLYVERAVELPRSG